MALCRAECIDLTTKSIKILGINFSDGNQNENYESFVKLIKIEGVFDLWRMRNLTIQVKKKNLQLSLIKDYTPFFSFCDPKSNNLRAK